MCSKDATWFEAGCHAELHRVVEILERMREDLADEVARANAGSKKYLQHKWRTIDEVISKIERPV